MAEVGEGADAVRAWLTGATADGETQPRATLSLGAYRSATEERGLQCRRANAMAGLRVEFVSGQCGLGLGQLVAKTADSIAFGAPGEAIGASVTIANGETKVVISGGSDAAKYLRVKRVSAAALNGAESLRIAEVYTNAVAGGSDVSDAQATAGTPSYHALMLRTERAVTGLAVWVRPVTSRVTTSAAQLGASGTGTIGGAAGAFVGWPKRGFALVRTSGGSQRELVYFSRRTDSLLYVTVSGHRAVAGTTAAAGANTDTVECVPGLRLALETPTGSAITLVANETTKPAGLTWVRAYQASEAVSYGSLGAGLVSGLWVERLVPAAMVADPWMPGRIAVDFTADAVSYSATLRGRYRVINTALHRVELYVGVGAYPDLEAAPAASGTSFPLSAALTRSARNYVLQRRRNKFNQVSQNMNFSVYDIDAGGLLILSPPSAPAHFDAVAVGAGTVRVRAVYNRARDENPADAWVVYAKIGSDPVPGTDSPVLTPALSGMLEAMLPTSYPDGADVRVLVRTRRTTPSVRDSENTTAVRVVADALNPGRVRGAAFLDSRRAFLAEPTAAPASPTDDYIIDAGNNIRVKPDSKGVSLYWGITLIWRCVVGGAGKTTYFPSGWSLDATRAPSGAGSSAAIEVLSATSGDKRMSVNVSGVRRLLIDVTNQAIGYGARDSVDDIGSIAARALVFPRAAATYFQCWDRFQEDMVTYMRVDADGTWRIDGAVDFTLGQSAIEAI